MIFPKIKKSIAGFLLEEEGDCGKKDILKMGIIAVALSAASARAGAVDTNSDQWELKQRKGYIGLSSGRLTAPVDSTWGGYTNTGRIRLEFYFGQLKALGIYPDVGADYVDMAGGISDCQIFYCGEEEADYIADHVNDGSCCAIDDHFSGSSEVTLPTVHLHKNSLFMESDEGSVLTASHLHDVQSSVESAVGTVECHVSDHASHYNSAGNPCGHTDSDHLSSAGDWVFWDQCED